MELLIDWIKQIILFILLATVLEMLLPSSAWKKFVKIVVNLTLILIILQPVLSLFSVDTNKLLSLLTSPKKAEDILVGEKINANKNEIEKTQNESISKQVALMLKGKVADELASKYELTIIDLKVSVKENEARVFVTLDDISDDEAKYSQSFMPVSINVQVKNENNVNNDEVVLQKKEEVLSLFADKWDIEKADITINWNGE